MSFLCQFNFISKSRKYNISLWQYPPFIFVVLGLVIIGAILFTYFVGTEYLEPMTLILAIISITIVLFVFDYIIVNSFENLAEANLMRAEFINIISHEMRGPLTNTKWVLEILMKGNFEEKEKKAYFSNMKDGNDQMVKIINDIVSASKIEQGKWVFSKEEVSIKKIVEKTIKEVCSTESAKDIKINLNIEEIPEVSLDVKNFNQVFFNLLDNAIRYTKQGGEVKIKIVKIGNKVMCEIKDSGVGIPKREQKYIFNKFFRSKNILRYRTGGTGLGLFVAKNILKAMGGSVGFKSKEKIGSTFWFDVPV